MDHRDSAAETEALEFTRALSEALAGDGSGLGPGDCLGNYILDRCLGEGGMGTVWLADQIEPVRRQVAIKLSRRRRLTGQELSLFMLEREALARMNHPAVGQIFEAGTLDDGTPYFVMEYIHGDTLASYRASHALPVAVRVELTRKVCLGVEHAHQRGLLHCDLKPSNILITEVDGRLQPKIIDFGTAQRLDRKSKRGVLYGTPAYLAPEQVDPAASLDTRTDVYALGTVLYELLSGKRLHQSLAGSGDFSLDQIRSALAQRPAIELPRRIGSDRLSGLDRRELTAIIDKATSLDPEHRHASAGELAAELKAWLERSPVQSVSDSSWYRAACFFRRNRVLSLTSLAFVLVIGALLWRLAAQLDETSRQRDRAEQVVEMMLDTFRQADPYRYPGGSITVRELLRKTGDRLLEQSLDIDTRIHLLETLAEVQEIIEVHADAATTLSSIEDLMASTRAGAEKIERIRLSRARNVAYTEDISSALDMVQQLVHTARQRSDRSALFNALVLESELLDYLSRSTEAVASLEAAERLIDNDAKDEERLLVLHLRGKLDALADAQGAVSALEQALPLAEMLHGPDHKTSVTVRSDLAVAYARAGNYEQAVHHGRAVVEVTERRWGGDSAGLAIALDNLGVNLQRLGSPEHFEEAVALHGRARAMFQEFSGDDSWHLAVAENNLATGLAGLGEHATAIGHFETALALLIASLGEDNARVGIVSNNLARSLIVFGQLDRAAEMLDRAEAILERALSPEHPRVALLRITRAEWLIAKQRFGDARVALDAAQPIILDSFGPGSDAFNRLRAARDLIHSAEHAASLEP